MQMDGCKEATVLNYARAVRDLMHSTGKTLLELTEQEIIAQLCDDRDMKNLSSSTLNTKICSIKYLYREVYKRLDTCLPPGKPTAAGQAGCCEYLQSEAFQTNW